MADNPFDAFTTEPATKVAANPFDAFEPAPSEVATANPFDRFDGLQAQTPTLAPEPPKNQFDLGAVMNVIGQQPIVQEVGQAVQSPGNFIEGLDRLESGIPLAVAQAGDTAGGLSNLITDTVGDAVGEALGPDNPIGYDPKVFKTVIHAQTHGADALKKLLPPANSALAGMTATAAPMAIPLSTGLGAAKGVVQAAASGAVQMGLMSALQNLGEQYGQTNKIDLPQLGGATATGTALGASGTALVHGLGQALENSAKGAALKRLLIQKNSPKRIEEIHLKGLKLKELEIQANQQAAAEMEAQAAQQAAGAQAMQQAAAEKARMDAYHAQNDLALKADAERRKALVLQSAHEAEKAKRQKAFDSEMQKMAAREAEFQRVNEEHDNLKAEAEVHDRRLSAMGKHLEAAKLRQAGLEAHKEQIEAAAKRLDEHRKAEVQQRHLEKIDNELKADAERRKGDYFASQHRAELLERERKLQEEYEKAGITHFDRIERELLPEPKINPIRKEAVELRHTPREVVHSRPGTASEANHLKPTLDAKLKVDIAKHNYEQAAQNLAEHMKQIDASAEGLKKADIVMPPEAGEELRKVSAEAVGIVGKLKERSRLEPNLIRHHEADPHPDYQMKGKTSFEKAAEVRYLRDKLADAMKEYKTARDAAKIQSLLKPEESIRVGDYVVNNALKKKYLPPNTASAAEKLAYEKEYGRRAAQWREEAQKLNTQLKPAFDKIAEDLEKVDPIAAKVLRVRGDVLTEPATLKYADKAGVLQQFKDFVKLFVENETGSFTPEHSASLITTPAKLLIKAVKDGVRIARNFGLDSGWAQWISLTRLNSDIIARHNPVFAADLKEAKRLFGKARLINGKPVEPPRSHAGMKAWVGKLSDKEIDALPVDVLNADQKTALKAMNREKANCAALIRQEMRDVEDREKYALADKHRQEGKHPHMDNLEGDELEQALEEAAKKTRYTPSLNRGTGAYLKTLEFELNHNFGGSAATGRIGGSIKPLANWASHNFSNYVQFSNMAIHGGIHMYEALSLNLGSAPIGATKGLISFGGMAAKSAMNVFRKAGENESIERQFVKMHGFNAPDYNLLRESSDNPFSNAIGEMSDKLRKFLPDENSKLAQVGRFVQRVGSGRGIEADIKVPISLMTASERAAHAINKMNGKSEADILFGRNGVLTGAKLREKMVKGELTLAEEIKASTVITDHMQEVTGSSLDGIKDMSAIDRFADETNDLGKLFLPLSQALFRHSRYYTRNTSEGIRKGYRGVMAMIDHDATQAEKEMAAGNISEALGHARSVVVGASVMTMLNGAYTAPGWLREGIARMSPDGEALHEFDTRMESLAVAGNAMGMRVPHASIEPLPILRVGQNLIQNTADDVEKASGKKGPDQQRNAAIKLGAEVTGQAALLNTIGYEALAKGFSHWKQAKELGGVKDWVFSPDAPFGLGKGKFIDVSLEKRSPEEAAIEAMLHPGHSMESTTHNLEQTENDIIRRKFFDNFGEARYKPFKTLHDAMFEESDSLKGVAKTLRDPGLLEAAKSDPEITPKMLAGISERAAEMESKSLKRRTEEQNTEVEVADGTKVAPKNYWRWAYKYALDHAPPTPSKPTNTGPSGPIAQN